MNKKNNIEPVSKGTVDSSIYKGVLEKGGSGTLPPEDSGQLSLPSSEGMPNEAYQSGNLFIDLEKDSFVDNSNDEKQTESLISDKDVQREVAPHQDSIRTSEEHQLVPDDMPVFDMDHLFVKEQDALSDQEVVAGEEEVVDVAEELSESEEEQTDWFLLSSMILGGAGILGGGAVLLSGDEKSSKDSATVLSGEPTEIGVQGQVIFGPVMAGHGLSVEILSLDDEQLALVKPDSNGYFQTTIPAGFSSVKARVIDVSGDADYLNQATGGEQDLSATLIAVTSIDPASEQIILNINPLTTVAARLSGLDENGNGQSVTDGSVASANASVGGYFLGDADLNPGTYEIQTVFNAEGAVTTGNTGGQVLAIVSALETVYQLDTNEVIDLLVSDFQLTDDGTLISSSLLSRLGFGIRQLESQLDAHVFADFEAYLQNLTTYIDQNESLDVLRRPGEGGNTIALMEDGTHFFSLNDFAFLDYPLGDSLTSITFSNLPQQGYFRFDGVNVEEDTITVDVVDLDRLSYKGRANESGLNYSFLTFSLNDGVSNNVEHNLIFDIQEKNDSPVLDIEEAFLPLVEAPYRQSPDADLSMDDPAFAALSDGSFVNVWIEQDDTLMGQVFSYQEGISLAPTTEAFQLSDSFVNEGARLLNPKVAAFADGGFAVTFWVHDQHADTASRLVFVDAAGVQSGGEINLGENWFSQSIITLDNGYTALGYVKEGEDSHFGIHLFDREGQLVRNVNLAPAYDWGAGDIALAKLPSGGFVASFSTVSEEVNETGFAYFNSEGVMYADSLQIHEDQVHREPEMVVLANGNIIRMHSEENQVFFEGLRAQETIIEKTLVNGIYNSHISNTQIIATTDGGFVVVWQAEMAGKAQLVGRYYDAEGVAASSEIVINELPAGADFGGVSLGELSDERIQLTWSDNHEGDHALYFSTLNTDALQQNLTQNVPVARINLSDAESALVSVSLLNDAGGLFELDETHSMIMVKDYSAIASSDAMRFDLTLRATDGTGKTETRDYQVIFPGAMSDGLVDTKYVLSLDGIDPAALNGLENFTLAELVELGLVKPLAFTLDDNSGSILAGPSVHSVVADGTLSDSYQLYLDAQNVYHQGLYL